jgi:acyl-CoA synthetase (NDP forming)
MSLLAASASPFVSEREAYSLIRDAGLHPPVHGLLGEELSFSLHQPVVLKGLGEDLWHKSELGCVRFLPFAPEALAAAAEPMRARVENAGHRWLGALVCERIELRRVEGLPTEALVSLLRGDGGWTAVMGLGGLQAEALAEQAPPLRWPLAFVTPAQALTELKSHLLGRIWLGELRGVHALTTEEALLAFLEGLWNLADLAEEEGLTLVEMNPVALDPAGTPRPLDAVGRREALAAPRIAPTEGFAQALLAPRRVALAGVSSQEGGVGRTILGNLRRCEAITGQLYLLKPGMDTFLGLPCISNVAALRKDPVDLLLLALPAAASVEVVRALIRQGGGAQLVALVAGGIGDGADTEGLGTSLEADLQRARSEGRWTPAVLGPNFLGHWVPSTRLDTSFIPEDRLAPPRMEGGPLAFLSQSGAFLLCRRSQQDLALGIGVALGNQMDAGLPEVLEALAERPELKCFAAYVEGFRPGGLSATARAAARLHGLGKPLLLYRAGRTEAGQAAAASHTGAMASDRCLEEALLRRAGVRLAPSQIAFDAALGWLGAYPTLAPGPVALLTNAGFESVTSGDLLADPFPPATLTPALETKLQAMLTEEGLNQLVAAHLPLDLTPMADGRAYLRAAEILLESEAAIIVIGLVPFTRRLPGELGQVEAMGHAFAALAKAKGKAIALVVDAGADHGPYRDALARSGLPVFTRVEKALMGLMALA